MPICLEVTLARLNIRGEAESGDRMVSSEYGWGLHRLLRLGFSLCA